jgi:hypothetical protein
MNKKLIGGDLNLPLKIFIITIIIIGIIVFLSIMMSLSMTDKKIDNKNK